MAKTAAEKADAKSKTEEKSKIDPFDVAALEKSLNDSATRVSTIWLSFVAFSAYLAAAASNITHRQLFLEDPIKLPTINIDLPLVGSAVFLPAVFVIYHIYLLLQIVLLARTAMAYDEAVQRTKLSPSNQARLRQRLPNTLFAQFFAGASSERTGLLGLLLGGMAQITLILGPCLILLLFQIKFLPYHGAGITWLHRALIAGDILVVLLLWPLTQSRRPKSLLRYFARPTLGQGAGLIVILISCLLLTYPGEPHADWTRFERQPQPTQDMELAAQANAQMQIPIECRRRSVAAPLLPQDFDHLALAGEDFVDDDRLKKIESSVASNREAGVQGAEVRIERTRMLAGRDFKCANLAGTDLRRADFSSANMFGANLNSAELQGASFHRTNLREASLTGAQAQDARFDYGFLEGAVLTGARMQGATFNSARLQGANLTWALLAGADFTFAHLEGANLQLAQLQGAMFNTASAQGALFTNTSLRGTNFFVPSHMLWLAEFSHVHVWGPKSNLLEMKTDPPMISCAEAQITNPTFDDAPDSTAFSIWITGGIKETPFAGKRRFMEFIFRGVPEGGRAKLEKSLSLRVYPNETFDPQELQALWLACAERALPEAEYQQKLISFLVDFVCADQPGNRHIAVGIYRHRFAVMPRQKEAFVTGLLNHNGKPCPVVWGLDPETRREFQR